MNIRSITTSILRRVCACFLFTFWSISCSGPEQQVTKNLDDVKQWFVLLDYDSEETLVDTQRVQQFDMAVFDPDVHPPFKIFDKDTILIAYVSVGEAETYRAYWPVIKNKAWVLNENPHWEGNYFVDVRNAEWQATLLDAVIPPIIAQGFQGLMLDTIDTAEMLESQDPLTYKGARDAMAALIKKIHQTYPQLLLLSNNGFSLLDTMADALAGLIAEDIYMMIDFEHGGYTEVPADEREYKIAVLSQMRQKYSLPVFTIEYVPAHDTRRREQIEQASRALGFVPYVAQKALDEIYAQE